MTRRIVLELGETTTETHCGDCPLMAVTRRCIVYGFDPRVRSVVDGSRRRSDLCRAAEANEVGDAE